MLNSSLQARYVPWSHDIWPTGLFISQEIWECGSSGNTVALPCLQIPKPHVGGQEWGREVLRAGLWSPSPLLGPGWSQAMSHLPH